MDRSTKPHQSGSGRSSGFRWTSGVRASIILAVAVGLGACGSAPQYRAKSEVEIAVGQINDQMLQRCEGVGATPDNTVGNLLQDSTDIAAVGATCITRHNNLVDYLAPIVAKEKQNETNQQPER